MINEMKRVQQSPLAFMSDTVMKLGMDNQWVHYNWQIFIGLDVCLAILNVM
jgi:hypothetical protein